MRKPSVIIPLEHDEQVKVIEWCALMARHKYPMLKWIFAIPNAARRSWALGKAMKAEGVKKGVPDLCLPHPTRFLVDAEGADLTLYHGLYIEMKRKGNTTTVDQKEWLDHLEYVGYKTAVAYSGDEAIKIIEEYIS
jgi:hypothetical protein